MMTESLLPARFFFRFAAGCLFDAGAHDAALGEQHRLPTFSEIDEQQPFADVRAGWNREGLSFSVGIENKKHPCWCRETKMDDSDGIQLWIDTRDTHNIHRASRFCHRFVFLPFGGGRSFEQPVADQLLIDRARENANPVRPGQLRVWTDKLKSGYRMRIFIPAGAPTGFNPDDHPRLGFTYAIFDREFGEQTFSVGSHFPFQVDPSLWGTLELVPAK